jgi:hypothetical protein
MLLQKFLTKTICLYLVYTALSVPVSGDFYLNFLSNLNNFFFNSLFLLVSLLSLPNSKFYKYCLFFFVVLWAEKLANPLITNWFYYSSYTVNITVVKELWLGLVNIHPPMLYVGLFFFFNWRLSNLSSFELINLPLNLILLFTGLAFILGGFWGWFNASWSYFWVFDYIEYFLLLSVLWVISVYHLKSSKTNNSLNLLPMSILLLYFLGLRYEFFLTRHASFTKTSCFSLTVVTLLCCFHVLFYSLLKIFIIGNFLWKILAIFFSSYYYMFFYWLWFNSVIQENVFSFKQYRTHLLHILVVFIKYFFFLHTANYFYNFQYSKLKINSFIIYI